MKMNALAVLCLALAAGPVFAESHITGDPAKGEKVFRKCKSCHAVGEDAKSKTGPVLNGIIDRTAGTYEGFKYSKAMTGAGEDGLVWTVENLDVYLINPRKFVKGTKMSFAGLKKDSDRADVIAYLAGFE